MKKFFVIMLTFFAMSICVFAETEKGTFTLTEYLGITDTKENVDSICMYSERAFNNGGDFYVSPDTEEFFELADSIILTDVEDTPMKLYEEGNITPRDSLYIEVHFADGNMTFALMSALGEVDKYSLMMSRLPATDCVTDTENFLKLEEVYDRLLAEKREKLALPYKSSVYGGDTESAMPEKLTLAEYIKMYCGNETTKVAMLPAVGLHTGIVLTAELDADVFFSTADSITMTVADGGNIKNYSESPLYVIWIWLDEKNSVQFCLSVDGELAWYPEWQDAFPATEYIMSVSDAEMLINLYNEAFEMKNSYSLQSAVPVPKTEEAEQMPLPITDESEIQSGSVGDADIGKKYNPYALVIVVALMAAAVALTLALTKKKN